MEAKLTVKLPEDLRRRAKALAALRGETVSQVVREALLRYVGTGETPDDLREQEILMPDSLREELERMREEIDQSWSSRESAVELVSAQRR